MERPVVLRHNTSQGLRRMKVLERYEDILAQLLEAIRPFTADGFELRENTDLVKDLDLDSMKVMNLVRVVEDRFDMSIPLNILPHVRTVKDFALQLQKLIKEGP
jgi:acyl carrier protein